MTVHFCGLARDCEDTISRNLDSIIRIGEDDRIDEYKIWVAENDSEDRTKGILKGYDEQNENIKFFDYEGLDEKIESRVKRILYLREDILNKLKKYVINKKENVIYCPIDLDSEIANSIDLDVFISECERVAKGEVDAIFPTSEPYYYDIYALRKEGWVENNCWGVIGGERTNIGSFWAKYRNIYSKQIPVEETVKEGRIEVDSAFGGLGIYRFTSVDESSYKKDVNKKDEQERGVVCEHVGFNRQIERKEVSNKLIVKSPDEHIGFRLKSNYQKVKFILRLLVLDAKKVVYKFIEIILGKDVR